MVPETRYVKTVDVAYPFFGSGPVDVACVVLDRCKVYRVSRGEP